VDKLEPTLANLEVVPSAAATAAAPDLHPELNRLLMRKLPFDFAGEVVLLAIAAALVYRHAEASAFWIWLGFAAGMQGLRYLLALLWRRDPARPDPGVLLLTLSALGAGLAWGALALTPLYAATNVPTQTMVMWTVAAAIIWFASTQAARALPFAAFAGGALGPWLLKIPGMMGSGSGALSTWIQPESNNLIALGLFVAFAGLAAVVYLFQRQAEARRLRVEAEVGPLNEDRASLAMRVDQLNTALQTQADTVIPAQADAAPAPHAAAEQPAARIEPQPHNSQALRVITSIDNMLALTKLAEGSAQVAKQRVSLRAMLDELLLPSLKHAHDKRLKLRCVLHAGVPLEIVSDQEKLLHILANLIGNAINFTHRGEVVLSVRRIDGGSGCRLSFEVADTGLGIRAEDQQRVFEPYYQVGTRKSDSFGGLGLGLTVAQRLAQLLGGDIALESQTGKGTMCILVLPVDLPSDATPRVTTTEELTLGIAPSAARSSATLTRLPAANDAFTARGDGFRRRQEPVYASRHER
jgi:signal transduction histidine kinase